MIIDAKKAGIDLAKLTEIVGFNSLNLFLHDGPAQVDAFLRWCEELKLLATVLGRVKQSIDAVGEEFMHASLSLPADSGYSPSALHAVRDQAEGVLQTVAGVLVKKRVAVPKRYYDEPEFWSEIRATFDDLNVDDACSVLTSMQSALKGVFKFDAKPASERIQLEATFLSSPTKLKKGGRPPGAKLSKHEKDCIRMYKEGMKPHAIDAVILKRANPKRKSGDAWVKSTAADVIKNAKGRKDWPNVEGPNSR